MLHSISTYSVYLLYWYKSTKTDASAALVPVAELLGVRCGRASTTVQMLTSTKYKSTNTDAGGAARTTEHLGVRLGGCERARAPRGKQALRGGDGFVLVTKFTCFTGALLVQKCRYRRRRCVRSRIFAGALLGFTGALLVQKCRY